MLEANMHLNYSNYIAVLQSKFPELDWSSDTTKEMLDLPYILLGYIFIPFIKESLLKNVRSNIKRIFDFLEEMAMSDDEEVRNILQVGILEALWDDAHIFCLAQKNMRSRTSIINHNIVNFQS